MEKSKFKGYYASQKIIEGEVVVVNQPIDLVSLDPMTGSFRSGHEYEGQSIKDKILVTSCLCGVTVAEFIPFFLNLTGNKPKAILTTTTHAYTPVMSGCVVSEIPLIYCVDKKLLERMKTGDTVVVDTEKEEVTLR